MPAKKLSLSKNWFDYALNLINTEDLKLSFYFKSCPETELILDCKWEAIGFNLQEKECFNALAVIVIGQSIANIKNISIEETTTLFKIDENFLKKIINYWHKAELNN